MNGKVDEQGNLTIEITHDEIQTIYREAGYKLVKIEDPIPIPIPIPDPTPDPITSVGARGLAIDLSGKPNFLAGVSHNNNDEVVNLGVKPNIYYRYLCGGYGNANPNWRGWDSPDGTYVDIVIRTAQELGAIPMFTYYQLALELERKNTGIFMAHHLRQYVADLKVMFTHIASFDIPVIVHLEPDFFGYLQQQEIDPNTTRTVERVEGFPATVTGLMMGIVAMGKRIAPKVKIGYSASRWGRWFSPTDPNADIKQYAYEVADFLKSMGTDETDFITLEISDRDAGFYETQGQNDRYFDESNQKLPHYKARLEWNKAVSERLGLPYIMWQLPLGVPSDTPSGSPLHYRDNAVHYLFRHVQDVIDSGGFGMVFGPGAAGQTTIMSDSGQFKEHMDNYNVNPMQLPGDIVVPDPTPEPEPEPQPEPEPHHKLQLGPDNKLQIHTIGDSITEHPRWRGYLYDSLKAKGISTDFIGSVTDPYPQSPEPQHDGHGGYTTRDANRELNGWFSEILKPELTIIMIGTNDVAWWIVEEEVEIVKRLDTIITRVQANSPNGIVIVASIPPQGGGNIGETVGPNGRNRNHMINVYNQGVEALVYSKTEKQEAVYFVDIFSALTLADLRDGIHPNESGNVKAGKAFLAQIEALLP